MIIFKKLQLKALNIFFNHKYIVSNKNISMLIFYTNSNSNIIGENEFRDEYMNFIIPAILDENILINS